MRAFVVGLVATGALVAGGSGAHGQGTLRFETEDWVFSAPTVLGTQADLELGARQVQLCSDEIALLVGHRPRNVEKFTWTYEIGGGPVSYASPTGVTTLVPSSAWRLVDPVTRAFRESVVQRGVCFGPHEVTHVLSWQSWGPAWANEGFATFTDRLYDSASWRCCSATIRSTQRCDEPGYTDGPNVLPYADLSQFRIDFAFYSTAACFWFEIHRLGGFPAIRGILAGMRRRPPVTTGQLVVHQAGRVLNTDLRRIAERYGFDAAELAAGPTPSIPGCTLIGSGLRDAISGTGGHDVICGLSGNDRLTGGAGRDMLSGGTGNDALHARDERADVVRGGPGRDVGRVDRSLDRVVGVEKVLR